MVSRKEAGALVSEFVGTSALVSVVILVSHMFGGGTSAWYTALTTGLVLAVLVGMFGRASGGHFNPAVTIGHWTQKKIETQTAIFYVAVQILGGVVALSFFNYATGGNLTASDSFVFEWNVFVAELVGAAVFGMGLVSVASQKLEGLYAALTTGLSLTLGMLIATMGSVGFLNPSVAFGNDLWNRTTVAAPIVGVVIGMHIYATYVVPAMSGKKK